MAVVEMVIIRSIASWSGSDILQIYLMLSDSSRDIMPDLGWRHRFEDGVPFFSPYFAYLRDIKQNIAQFSLSYNTSKLLLATTEITQ